MPSGGARSRSGPAPDPNALRRDRGDDAPWLVLPSTGRQGDPPAIPLPDALDAEVELWNELWVTPQAVEWERLGLEREVALYVRAYVHAIGGYKVAAADRNLVRQLADSLGLNTAGLNRNRWKIGTNLTLVEQAETDPDRPVSARDRLRSVGGGA